MYKNPVPVTVKANGSTTVHLSGATFLRVRETNASFNARLDNEDIGKLAIADKLKTQKGFDKLFIENNENFDLNIVLDVAKGEISSDSLILDKAIKALTVGGSSIDTNKIDLTQTKKQLVANNTARVRLGVHNSGVADVYIGGSNLINANGWLLESGEKIFFDVSSEIFAKCKDDVAGEVRIIESFE